MDAHYERQYHEIERTHWWFRARRQLVLELLRRRECGSILDIGCSSGAMLSFLSGKGFSQLNGIDVSNAAADSCKAYGLSVAIACAENLPFQDSAFDTAIASDILEHTRDDGRTMREWNRVLRQGGTLILFVPAFMHLWSGHDELNHHYKRYTLRELRALAKRNGFAIRMFSYWNVVLYPLDVLVTFVKRLRRSKASNLKPASRAVNAVLSVLLSIENMMIAFGVNFPVGISCFCVLEKQ